MIMYNQFWRYIFYLVTQRLIQINQSINLYDNFPHPCLIYLTGLYSNQINIKKIKTYLLFNFFDFRIHFNIRMSGDYVNKEISGSIKAKVDFF